MDLSRIALPALEYLRAQIDAELDARSREASNNYIYGIIG